MDRATPTRPGRVVLADKNRYTDFRKFWNFRNYQTIHAKAQTTLAAGG
jgi:hypothetical protein